MPAVNLPSGNQTYNGDGNPDDNYVITQTVGPDGNNTITLGNGTDQLTLGAGNNTITLGDGPDQLILGGGNNTVTTGNGNSKITVGDGNDVITVGTASNTIVLGTGLDTVSTKAGNTTVSVAGTAVSGDTIHGALSTFDGSTNQLVLTAPGAAMNPVNVYGFQSYLLANGGPNNLTLSEGNFTNLPLGSITVMGGDSGNTVNAAALSAAHSVVIYGGAGLDMLTGGAGNDRFIFAASDLSADTVAGGTGNNTLELATGGGIGKVNGLGGANFSGLAVIDVDAGASWLFTSTQAVTDTIKLAGGATAEFAGSVGSGHTIDFTSASGVLKIDTPTQFAGLIFGFQLGATIDLTSVGFSGAGSAILETGNVLQVAENGQTYNLKLNPTQSFAGEQFSLSSDGAGGTNITVSGSTPQSPTANMILRDASNGNYEIYNIGGNTILAASPLGQVGLEWQFVGIGGFNNNDTSDMILRDINNGALEVYDINNNQIVSAGPLGNIGMDWQPLGFGDFSGNPGETDMLMRNTNNGSLEVYDIKNNQIASAGPMGNIGMDWQPLGFGDFSGNPGETDMLMRNTNNGSLEVYDIKNNQIASAGPMGGIGTEWQALGFGDFSGNPGETDMLMRNTNNGALEVYDIKNNQIVSAGPMGSIGMEWQALGFGDFSGNPGETDMLMRNTNNGALEVYDIKNNQIVSATPAGSIATEWQLGGVADALMHAGSTLNPPTSPSSSALAIANTTSQLAQAMASFSAAGAAIDHGVISQSAQDATSQFGVLAASPLQHATAL